MNRSIVLSGDSPSLEMGAEKRQTRLWPSSKVVLLIVLDYCEGAFEAAANGYRLAEIVARRPRTG